MHRGGSIDIPLEGYGKVARSRVCHPSSRNQNPGRDFFSEKWNGRDSVGSMLEIVKNNRTEVEGEMEEVLKRRGKLYGDKLNPKWFRHEIDLGVMAKTTLERNQARAMLVAAPLMLAQEGALNLRKRLLQGDINILSELQSEESTTFSEVLKKLGAAPPLAVLRLCNRQLGDYVMDSLLQHSDDLDFVQDVLDAIGSQSALTPTMHGVLCGLMRRRNYGRFKGGQWSIGMDIMRFSHLASQHDKDGRNKQNTNSGNINRVSKNFCQYFQRVAGCRKQDACRHVHRCIICDDKSHGACNCRDGKEGISRERRQGIGSRKERRSYRTRKKDERSKSLPDRRRRH